MVELAGIVILGILAQWLAWRFKIPAILPLILIGLLAGPISAEFITADGSKWIQPTAEDGRGFWTNEGFYYFVSLSISIILFEGGLTLKFSEFKKVGPTITKLITLGSAITFFCGAIAAHFVFGLTWDISFLFAALIIVTGPTVITPILRNIPLKKDVSAVLKWEGILIDPIGALVAVLAFNFIRVEDNGAFTFTALKEFGKIILFGCTFGFTFAHAFNFLIKKEAIPHYLINVFGLALVLGVFVLSESFAHESGLLAVVVMGMVLGNIKSNYINELLYFKESLSVLLISILFIVLAAHMDMDDLYLVMNWNTAILLAIIIFVIRPLGVFLSAHGSSLKFNEKLFISWVGPRGIVAAGIASLFGATLVFYGVKGAEYITPLVFAVVLTTVILNATTARPLAKWIGVFLKKQEGILILGASQFPILLGNYLKSNGRRVVMIDSNQNNIDQAKSQGMEAFVANIYTDTLTDNIELNDIGYLMALTGNSGINAFALERFSADFGENGAFRLISTEESKDQNNNPERGLFSHIDDYSTIDQVAKDYPSINEIALDDQQHYQQLIDLTNKERTSIPLFVKSDAGHLEIISSYSKSIETVRKGDRLVYLGKKLIA